MRILVNIIAIISLSLTISACGGGIQATPAPSITSTVDPCSSTALPEEVDSVHKLMREFDDASLLATNTPRDQLPPLISDMQRIRRTTEDQIVPSCLGTLKQLLLKHMNTVINTLVAFLGGADQNVLNQGAELARQQHNDYAVEYARLLGLTVVVAPTSTPNLSVTDTPLPVTTEAVGATNSGSQNVNLYSDPSVDATVVAVLFVDQTARIVSQNPDGTWLQVEIPGQINQYGWVEASSITLSPWPP